MTKSDCTLIQEQETQMQHRRGFLAKLMALLAGTVTLVTPAAVGIVAFFSPLRQKGREGGFVKLTTLDSLPQDGRPRKFPVIADRTDAWNRFPDEPVGAVWLRRTGNDQIEALQVVCPHAGCSILFEKKVSGTFLNPSAKNAGENMVPDTFFSCPCHGAKFDLSGKRLDNPSPSPRDMDRLEVETRADSEVWVKFQTFSSGTANKKVISG